MFWYWCSVEDQDKGRNDTEYKEKEDFNLSELILELEFLFTNCSADMYYVNPDAIL